MFLISTLKTIFQIFLLLITAFSVFTAIYFIRKNHSNKNLLNLLQKEIDNYKGKLLKQELENVQVELNPHLFKNTLNAIQSYAFKTHIALDRLGTLLDFILYDSRNGLISIHDEIEFVKNFIELNKLRLNPLFEINFKAEIDDSDPLFEKPLLVPLVTSHLIENAFKHGDLNSNEGFIDIMVRLKDGIFYCIIANKKNPSPVMDIKGGFGKENLQKRLELAYKDKYELNYREEDNLYNAILKIDLNV
jgi:LytS/YehU family sensor histidine kinase